MSPLTGVEAPIISEAYILMPGDQVLVTIGGSVTYSYAAGVGYEGRIGINIPVSPSPTAPLQVVDVVGISGLNIKAAQDSLGNVFRHYFRSSTVKLTLIYMRTGVVFVTGEVESPGAVYATPVERVSQVVAKAGGVTPLGSRSRIELIRDNKLYKVADIFSFENRGDVSANPFVESGDRIFVPPVSGLVTVKGAVFGRGGYRLRSSALTTEKERISEGMYELLPGERVADAIRKAGGITPWADLKAGYMLRRDPSGSTTKRIPLNLHAVLFSSDSASNPALQNDDAVIVPPINTLVYVEGEVQHPGSFLYTPNLKVNDYVGMAGGPTTNASAGQTMFIRGDKRLAARNNPPAEPGDIVWVPRVSFKWWQDYLQIFSAVGMPVAIALLSYYGYRTSAH
jgi:protein involved in polysaccharide export with SLBB domain